MYWMYGIGTYVALLSFLTTFPSLTMLEVAGTRLEGAVAICHVRPSISRADESDALKVCAAAAPEEAVDVRGGGKAPSPKKFVFFAVNN